jgi:hypothetical protein
MSEELLYWQALNRAMDAAAQLVVASRQTPAQIDTTQAPASSAVFPQLPPPNSGQ